MLEWYRTGMHNHLHKTFLLQSIGLIGHLTLLVSLLISTVACRSTTDTPSMGNIERGRHLFHRTSQIVRGVPACHTCHVLDPTAPEVVGPRLSNIATTAATRVPDLSAKDYLRQSIIQPNTYIVPGYQPSIMVSNYRTSLSPQQVEDIVAFLMTLDGSEDGSVSSNQPNEKEPSQENR